MLLTWRKPDHVTRPDGFHRTAPSLGASAARRDDERLAQRMRMPRRSRTRIEGDTHADDPCGIRGFEERIDARRAGEIIRRTFGGGL